MTAKTLERIVELWPNLSEAARADILDIAEGAAAQSESGFTAEDLRMIEQGREDFKHGRFLEADAYHARMRAFLDRLKTLSQP